MPQTQRTKPVYWGPAHPSFLAVFFKAWNPSRIAPHRGAQGSYHIISMYKHIHYSVGLYFFQQTNHHQIVWNLCRTSKLFCEIRPWNFVFSFYSVGFKFKITATKTIHRKVRLVPMRKETTPFSVFRCLRNTERGLQSRQKPQSCLSHSDIRAKPILSLGFRTLQAQPMYFKKPRPLCWSLGHFLQSSLSTFSRRLSHRF